MKIRLMTILLVLLLGLFSLFASTAVLAHNPGYGHAYTGVPLITIRGNYYSHSGYAGNLSLGFAGAYANHRYAHGPYYDHVQAYSYGHLSRYGYAIGYQRGYRYAHHNRHHNRHHYDDHHGRHH